MQLVAKWLYLRVYLQTNNFVPGRIDKAMQLYNHQDFWHGSAYKRSSFHLMDHVPSILQHNTYRWWPFYQSTTYHTSVSYTHLRAHETGRNIVCRLLLEKKKKKKKKKKAKKSTAKKKQKKKQRKTEEKKT